jgi:hypothetical protein
MRSFSGAGPLVRPGSSQLSGSQEIGTRRLTRSSAVAGSHQSWPVADGNIGFAGAGLVLSFCAKPTKNGRFARSRTRLGREHTTTTKRAKGKGCYTAIRVCGGRSVMAVPTATMTGPSAVEKGVFYEKFADVNGKADSLAVVSRRLLRTRFLYAVMKAKFARCLWAFFRRSDAAICRTAFSTKTPAQSSNSGVNRNHQLQEELRPPPVRRTGYMALA